VPRVHFTPNLKRHLECPPKDVHGGTLRDVLEHVFEENPRLRGYVLDDRGAVRKHVAIFVAGAMIGDRRDLTDPIGADDEVYVMQALSGG